MKLIEPSLAYAASFSEALKEFGDGHIPALVDQETAQTDVSAYIEKIRLWETGKNLPEGFVPASTYWLIDNEQFIGHVNVRHILNDRLHIIGGHIGYAIRPSMQAKGYGTKLLALALVKARALGLEKVLITCDADNIASRKVIEKNGGMLYQQILVNGEQILQFYIDLL